MKLKLIKFYHEADIKIITDQLPLLLGKDLEKKYEATDNFKINKLSKPYNIISDGIEMNISEYEIEYSGKKVALTFIENVLSAEMTIDVDNKPVGSVKKMKERSPKLIVDISNAVRESIKSQP